MSINANRHARARGHSGKGWGARATAWILASETVDFRGNRVAAANTSVTRE